MSARWADWRYKYSEGHAPVALAVVRVEAPVSNETFVSEGTSHELPGAAQALQDLGHQEGVQRCALVPIERRADQSGDIFVRPNLAGDVLLRKGEFTRGTYKTSNRTPQARGGVRVAPVWRGRIRMRAVYGNFRGAFQACRAWCRSGLWVDIFYHDLMSTFSDIGRSGIEQDQPSLTSWYLRFWYLAPQQVRDRIHLRGSGNLNPETWK